MAAVGSVSLVFIVCYVGWLLLHGFAFGFAASVPTGAYLYMAISTILGVVSSILVTGFRALPPTGRVKLEQIGDMLMRPGALIALCVSPIVFYTALIATDGQ